jgi:hypothetical protein
MFDSQALSAQQSVSTAISPGISSLANNMFIIITDIRTQQSLIIICVILTVFAIYVWCVGTHQNFKEKGLRPKVKEILLPLILIVLTFNNVRDMKDSMFNQKNTVNIVGVPSNKVVDKSDSQSATKEQINSYLKSVSNSYLLDL